MDIWGIKERKVESCPPPQGGKGRDRYAYGVQWIAWTYRENIWLFFAYPSPMMSIISNTSSGSSGEIESLRRSFFFLTFSSSDEDMVNYELESCWLWRNLRAKKREIGYRGRMWKGITVRSQLMRKEKPDITRAQYLFVNGISFQLLINHYQQIFTIEEKILLCFSRLKEIRSDNSLK